MITVSKVFWGVFALLVLSVGFGYYAAFQSPLAANWVLSRAFSGTGVTFEPAIGNLTEGLVIPTIRKAGADYDLSIDGVKFKFSAVLDLAFEKKFKIDSYAIDRIELDVKKAELAAFLGAGDKDAPSALSHPGAKIFSDFPILEGIEVTEFRISNLLVRYPIPGMTEKKNLNVKQVVVSAMELTKNVFKFADADFRSNEAEVAIAGLEIRDGEIKRVGNMVGKLKAAYAPDKMKKDVDYVVKYVGVGAPKSIGMVFKGFGGKIEANLSATGPVALTLKDFNYAEYFKESFPISNLNAELKAPNILLFMTGAIEAKGAFKVGDIPFNVLERDPAKITNPAQLAEAAHSGVQAYAEKGSQKFIITFLVDRFMSETQKVVMSKVAKADRQPASLGIPESGVGLLSEFPVLAFESNLTKSSQDNFAFLYYSIPYAELVDDQKKRVDQETWIFDKSYPPAPKVARKIQKRVVYPLRNPASTKPAPMKSGAGKPSAFKSAPVRNR